MNILRNFLSNESGATALEYGLIIAATSVAILVSLQLAGDNLGVILSTISTALQ